MQVIKKTSFLCAISNVKRGYFVKRYLKCWKRGYFKQVICIHVFMLKRGVKVAANACTWNHAKKGVFFDLGNDHVLTTPLNRKWRHQGLANSLSFQKKVPTSLKNIFTIRIIIRYMCDIKINRSLHLIWQKALRYRSHRPFDIVLSEPREQWTIKQISRIYVT